VYKDSIFSTSYSVGNMVICFMKQITTTTGGVKGGQHVKLTSLPPYVSQLSRENVGASTSHNPMGLYGLLQG
jgi:hypothetical protein